MSILTETEENERELSAAEYLEHAIDDLKEARDQAGAEIREKIDSAMTRARQALAEFRAGAGERKEEWRHMLEDASDEARRDIGIYAVRAQRSPEALKQLEGEVRERREDLRLSRSAD